MPIAKEQLEAPAQIYVLPAPVGGLNTVDPVANMDPAYALEMKNWFPSERSVSIRKGYSSFVAVSLVSAVQTLTQHCAEDGTKKFVAAANSKLWNISTGTPSTIGLSYANDYWQTVIMNHKTLFFNGEDTPQQYDGSSVSDATYTGISDPKTLAQATTYRNRLYAVASDSASFWYTAAGAITGAMSEYDCAYLLELGGNLEFVATWARNSGDYLSQVFVICSHEGEVLIFSGPSPDQDAWSMVAHLRIDRPLGRRAYLQRGADMEILTYSGPVSLSELMAQQNARLYQSSLTKTVAPSFQQRAMDTSGTDGWQVVAYPRGKYILYNIPTSTVTAEQFVRNMYTGAWARFTGQTALCWAVYNDELYFGTPDGKVMKADSGSTDNGAYIDTDLRLAFNFLGRMDRLKHVVMARPILLTSGEISFQFQVDMDYESRVLEDQINLVSDPGSEWDVAEWDLATWSSGGTHLADWYSVTGIGNAASVRLAAGLQNVSADLMAIQVMYEPGGIL